MTRPTLKSAAALILSGAMALTSTSAAFADARSYAHVHQQQQGLTGGQVAGGLLALLLLGQVINQQNQSRDNDRADRRDRRDDRQDRGDRRDRRHDRRADNYALPGDCMRRVRALDGQRLFMRGCLRRNDVSLRLLPRRCEVNFRAHNGNWRTGYRPRCLRRAGFYIGR